MQNKLYGYKLLHVGSLALATAERNGIRVDIDRLKEMIKTVDKEVGLLRERIYDTKDARLYRKKKGHQIDINSNQQIVDLLFNLCGYEPTKFTVTGQPSVDVEVMERLNSDFAKAVVEYRKMTKIRDTYLKNILEETSEDGFLHSFFHLHLVRSYRSSSSNINFQNVPKRDKKVQKIVRSVFVAREGHRLVEVDYSGMEVRVAACYNGDPVFIEYVTDSTKDMHRDTAMELFSLPENEISKEVRFVAKNGFVFAEFYGDYYKNCALRIWDMVEMDRQKTKTGKDLFSHMKRKFKTKDGFIKHVQKVEDRFWNDRFRVYAEWKDEYWRRFQEKGYLVTKTGFLINGDMKRNEVINTPIQGSAFHVLLLAFIRLDYLFKKRGLQSKIVGQIHDSIVLDVYESEFDLVVKMAKYVMTEQVRKEWDWLIVPLEIEVDAGEIGGSWSDLEEVKI